MPKISAHPKSLFNFNRRHLFRVSPQKMMDDLNDVLWLMNIRTQPSMTDPFVLDCECDYPDWTRFLQKPDLGGGNDAPSASSRVEEQDVGGSEGEPLRFTVQIYQARWAGGRLGVKVKEAEDEEGGRGKVFRNLYHTILYELGKTASS